MGRLLPVRGNALMVFRVGCLFLKRLLLGFNILKMGKSLGDYGDVLDSVCINGELMLFVVLHFAFPGFDQEIRDVSLFSERRTDHFTVSLHCWAIPKLCMHPIHWSLR